MAEVRPHLVKTPLLFKVDSFESWYLGRPLYIKSSSLGFFNQSLRSIFIPALAPGALNNHRDGILSPETIARFIALSQSLSLSLSFSLSHTLFLSLAVLICSLPGLKCYFAHFPILSSPFSSLCSDREVNSGLSAQQYFTTLAAIIAAQAFSDLRLCRS